MAGKPAAWVGLSARVAEHLRSPLFRNGYALLFSGAFTSGLGLVYWLLAARLYPVEIVGLNSTLLSAMVLLSGVAQLSLNNVLVRYLPVAGAQASRLVGYTYTASLVVAGLVSGVFILGVEVWAPALGFIHSSFAWWGGVILAVAAWSLFVLQDSVLVGLRQAVWVPVENAVFAVLKLVLLVALPSALPHAGIFISWVAPTVLALIPINAFIFWGGALRRPLAAGQAAARLAPGELIRFAGGNYAGTLLMTAYTYLLPIVVTNVAGAPAAAYFYLPWTVAAGMHLIAANLTTSLTVEATLARAQLAGLYRRVVRQTLRLLLPLVAVTVLAAPWLLQFFGEDYAAAGATLLRLLALATLPNMVIAVGLGILRVQNRSLWVAVSHGGVCLIVLALAFALLPRLGIAGVGWAWLISQVVMAGAVWWLALRPLPAAGAPHPPEPGR